MSSEKLSKGIFEKSYFLDLDQFHKVSKILLNHLPDLEIVKCNCLEFLADLSLPSTKNVDELTREQLIGKVLEHSRQLAILTKAYQ